MVFIRMVLGKIAGLISGRSSQLTSSKENSIPYMSAGFSSSENDANHRFGYVDSDSKISMRHCTSLQDLSTYRGLDLEGGNSGSRFESNSKFWQRDNAAASFSKQKVHVGSSVQCTKLLQKAITFFCVVLFLLLTYFSVSYIVSYWSQGTSKYYIVLDCGSTGTRVYVYEASLDHSIDDGLPIRMRSITDGQSRKPDGRAYDRMETEPGLHTFVRHTSGLKSAINPLLKWAEKQIPVKARRSASLFLYATAGVRRLPKEDSKWLLDKAYTIMKLSPFLCRREWIKIITGPEEAYFGWIALNFKTGVLGTIPRKQTFGSLDMGGSSLQVTFEGDKSLNDKVNINLRIGTTSHHVNAYSLSGYGLNDAFDKSVAHLFREKSYRGGGTFEIKHPCLHHGFKEEYVCSQCADNEAVGFSPSIKERNAIEKATSGVIMQLIGAPNWEECRMLSKKAVNLSEWTNLSMGLDCDLTPCAISDDLPKPYGQFYGLSGFYVVYRFYNLSSESATLDDVLEKGREFCEKQWDAAKNSVPPQPFIEQYCFRAPYIVSLLRQGLNITDSQIIIGTGSITWTSGVALLEAGNSFSTALRLRRYQILQVRIPPAAVVVILATSVIILLCALSFVGNWKKRLFGRPYNPLARPSISSSSSVLNLQNHLRFKRWSPISSATGDGRNKMPLSPIAGGHGAFGNGGVGGAGVQQAEASFYASTSGAAHSYSFSNLGPMNEGNHFMTPRAQMRLQSRRSQSREDLNSSLQDLHANF